jgi:hypothetical protein
MIPISRRTMRSAIVRWSVASSALKSTPAGSSR